MAVPYYADQAVALYHGDMREVLPALALTADCIVTDPPYGETSLAWDRWPDAWPTVAASVAKSMWCFGSMRMFLNRRDDFTGWKLSQDVIWDKQNGSGLSADRFRRVHEVTTHWYRGPWAGVYKDPQRVTVEKRYTKPQKQGRDNMHHLGGKVDTGAWTDDGTRLAKSIVTCKSVRGGLHPTEKPTELLESLIRYACPPGGLVLDPFAGSGSTAEAARAAGRRCVLVEADERYCEAIAGRLSQDVLPLTAG